MTLARLRRGAHLEKPRRRWTKWAIGVGIALALVAGTAWAVLSIVKTTASETVSARSIGDVDIGNMATAGLLAGDLAEIEPGFTTSNCVTAWLIDPQDGDVPRTWFSGPGGDLADDLHILVERSTTGGSTDDGTGIVPCTGGGQWTEIHDGTVAGLLADIGSYADGIEWTANGGKFHMRITLTLPGSVDANAAGDEAVFAGNFENRGGS